MSNSILKETIKILNSSNSPEEVVRLIEVFTDAIASSMAFLIVSYYENLGIHEYQEMITDITRVLDDTEAEIVERYLNKEKAKNNADYLTYKKLKLNMEN